MYLIRNTNDATSNIQDGRAGTALGAADAAVSVEPTNAECIGSLAVTASTATTFEGVCLAVEPGPLYSVVVWNASGQSSDSTNHLINVAPLVDETQ